MPQKKHTLEKIMDSMGKKFDEDVMHTAMLLSYAESIYGVVRKDCLPSPLYRVGYDETNAKVALEETQGYSQVPKKNALDISMLSA